MRCPECGFANAEDARHCVGCGEPLTTPGRSGLECDASEPQRELTRAQEQLGRLRRYVPAAVAEGVLHDQQRLRGERRDVTVLFADAVDFTRLTSSLDAEPTFRLINDLLGRLMACIHRYDGVVDKFTGDGLMAVFGAPVAHENDAELAVRAALDMQKAAGDFERIALAHLGAPVRIRIGINSGLTISGIIGTEQQASYTVIGDTVNLASRLEAVAQAGSVIASARVYHQTRALFNYKSIGTVRVKGIDHPIAIYELLGDRSEPLPTRGVTGVAKLFLGREAELAQFRNLVKGLLEDGRGRLVLVEGEAGMGKSRLMTQVLSEIPAGRAAIWQGRGLPYAQGVSFGVFRSLMQDALRNTSSDDRWGTHVSPTLRPLLRQVLGQKLTSSEQASLRLLEPERVKQLTALALREWLVGEAGQRPLVIVLEDFHWADDLSRDIWKSLINLIEEQPVLMCLITRPRPERTLLPDQSVYGQGLEAPLVLSLRLGPLSDTHSRALLGHLVDLGSLPAELPETILLRAEGNPLYIEEFVRMLIEKEVFTLGEGRWQISSPVALQDLEIPTSLRGLMMARVDRLPAAFQRILRTAAVIGLQFSSALVEAVEHRLRQDGAVVPVLQRLTDLGILEKRSPMGDEVFAFRHILAQETVYGSLMRSDRPAMHRAVAESIEQLHGGDLQEQAEVLALHYDRARLRDKAMHYALLAGDRARARFANSEAAKYYGRALQLSQHLSDCQKERWHAAVGLGHIQQHVGEYKEAVACYLAALEERRDALPEERAQVMLRLGQVWGDKRGDLDEGERWLREGLSLLLASGQAAPGLTAQILCELGWLSTRRGDFVAAQEQLERALEMVEETENYDVISFILNRLGFVHYSRSEWDLAKACVQRALAFRERIGDSVGHSRSLINLGIMKQVSGDWDGALADFERAAETQDRIGEVEGVILAHTNLGVLYTERGEWSRAEESLQRSFSLAQRIEHPHQLALAHTNLGRLFLLQQLWSKGAEHLNAAIPLFREAGARAHLGLFEVYNLFGRLCLDQEDVGGAEAWAERSHALLREVTGGDDVTSLEWGRHLQLIARIARARGDMGAARRHLDRSTAIFEQLGTTIETARTAYWSAVFFCDSGLAPQARKELNVAREIFERLGASADLDRVVQLLTLL